MILEVERFYEIEVNGVRCSIGWNSCFPVTVDDVPCDECKADWPPETSSQRRSPADGKLGRDRQTAR